MAAVGQAPGPSRDALTGLPDRASLQAHLDQSLGPVALLAVDVDGFRQINEEAGHDTGDHVLIQISRSLTRLAPPGGIAARLDGDDFLLTVPGDDIEDAWALATHTQRTLRQPVDVAGRRFHLNANVGIVLDHTPGRQHRHTAAEPATKAPLLLRCVDAALAAAQASPTGIAVHDEQTCRTAPADPLLEIVDDLHAALATDDQIQIHVQPQYALHQSGSRTPHSLSGCEALVRWQHPTRGLLGPGVLMRAARAGHLHRAITERVLELSIAAAATWWQTHQLTVSVNLTTEDLDDESLPHRIAAALAHHGLPAAALTVEVVEDSLMLDPPRAVRTLTALRAIGLTIAVDDYGTGYSSLAYLHRLPIDEVKFDRSLTAGVADDHAATAIVRHSVRLAHDLGLTVVAEGVERPQDLQRLRELGCDTVQGYLTGRPMPLAEWHTLLIAQAPSA